MVTQKKLLAVETLRIFAFHSLYVIKTFWHSTLLIQILCKLMLTAAQKWLSLVLYMYLLYVLAPASFPLQQAPSDVITSVTNVFPHIKLEHVLHRYIELKTITFISNSK